MWPTMTPTVFRRVMGDICMELLLWLPYDSSPALNLTMSSLISGILIWLLAAAILRPGDCIMHKDASVKTPMRSSLRPNRFFLRDDVKFPLSSSDSPLSSIGNASQPLRGKPNLELFSAAILPCATDSCHDQRNR